MKFVPRTAENGQPCCASYNAAGDPMMPDRDHMCDVCEAHFGRALAASDDTSNDYAPPSGYREPLAAMRAADAHAEDVKQWRSVRAARETPESRFAARWAERRAAEFAAEQADAPAEIAAHVDDPRFEASPFPRLTDAELAEYEPPNPYADGIKALQAKEAQK